MRFYWFYLLGRFFKKHSKTVSYFVFLILFRSILPLIKIILIKTQFVHFISLNITILLYLQFANLDCNKILTSFSQLYHLAISLIRLHNGQEKIMANKINFIPNNVKGFQSTNKRLKLINPLTTNGPII